MNITAFKNPIELDHYTESSNPHAETITFVQRVTYGTKRYYPANMSTQIWMNLFGNFNKTISPDQIRHIISKDKFNVAINTSLD